MPATPKFDVNERVVFRHEGKKYRGAEGLIYERIINSTHRPQTVVDKVAKAMNDLGVKLFDEVTKKPVVCVWKEKLESNSAKELAFRISAIISFKSLLHRMPRRRVNTKPADHRPLFLL